MNTEEVKRGVLRFCRDNRYVGITECQLLRGSAGVADVLGMGTPRSKSWRKAGKRKPAPIYVCHEFEVKVTLSDLKKDVSKTKWLPWAISPPVTHFWYAVPVKLREAALVASSDLKSLLLGKTSSGKIAAKAFQKTSFPSRAVIGVITFSDEHTWKVERAAKRIQKEVPSTTVNTVISRSFWELSNMRGLLSQHEQKNVQSLSIGGMWKAVDFPRKARIVEITGVVDSFVQYKNASTGRKGKSRIPSFCQKFNPV